MGSSVWADVGAGYSYTNPLAGSNGNERWYSPSATGTIGASTTITVPYYNQFFVTIAIGTGHGTTSPGPGSAWYNAGSTFSLKAVPASGQHFVDWTKVVTVGSITIKSPTAKTTTIVIDGSGTIYANFA